MHQEAMNIQVNVKLLTRKCQGVVTNLSSDTRVFPDGIG